MKPAAFEYHRPDDLPSALALLRAHEDASVLAGGQSLVPMMNYRLAQPDHLVDINRIDELDFIRAESAVIVIGALARHRTIQSSPLIAERLPMVAHAYEWIAHAAVRNRGTLCGNLCHADPASEMPALMQVLEAEMVLARADGTRRVPAVEFFTGTYETARAAGEMLTEVRIPTPPAGSGWGFEEVSMRKGDFAWAAVGCQLRIDNGALVDVRMAAAGVGDCALRLRGIEAALEGEPPSADLFAQAAHDAAEALDPPDTAAVSADYRRDLVRALAPRALTAAVARAE
ncbi:FAD binding domain-containing protein [Roseobacter sinensis]|uniref:Xanthine dehydrogenase family protein subunit M n=1 Tax=Roseobacter sinensis TaxID=2931391 RepID=A0ABT3BFJ0_9RHOB|nr:xanthine dehydrogenase family protein subunit M [Roseobacter sp. WL0113]MCV3271859.1 xanthine dehydrogenase family protein subunit M [Roseobacter sp. WL0113]